MSNPLDFAALSAQVLASLSDDSDVDDEAERSAEGQTVGSHLESSIDHPLAHSWSPQINRALQQPHSARSNTFGFLVNDLAAGTLPRQNSAGLDRQESLTGSATELFSPVTATDSIAFDEENHGEWNRPFSNLETSSLEAILASALAGHLNPKPASNDAMTQVDQMLDLLFNSGAHGASSDPHTASLAIPAINESPLALAPATTTTSSELAIDPLLGSLTPSPPTTLSAPQSPQPMLRTDASTSQNVLPTGTRLQPPPSELLPMLPTRPPTSLTTSLEQLANPPPGQQPNYPWWAIIRAAIMGSRYGMMTRDDICEALINRWEYFRLTDEHETRVWKSAVGHNLSVKECFVRVFVEGAGNTSYYIVDTAVDPVKGRLSKGKQLDRVITPRIARRPVIPSNLNLSTQARWSPAIAAIRNAKHGYPQVRHPAHVEGVPGSDSDDDDGDSDESDSGDSSDSDLAPQPLPGSRLGSSLSAITGAIRPSLIKQPARTNLQSIRSNSNSRHEPVVKSLPHLHESGHTSRPTSRQTHQATSSWTSRSSSRTTPSAKRPAPPPRRPISRPARPPNPLPSQVISSPCLEPVGGPSSPDAPFVPLSRLCSPILPSLEQQVAAALADVTASLPSQLEGKFPQSEPLPLSPSALPMLLPSPSPVPLSLEEQVAAALADVTAILPSQLGKEKPGPILQDEDKPQDAPSPPEPVCPLFDFDSLVREVQAEIVNELDSDDHSGDESSGGGVDLDLDTMLAEASAETFISEPHDSASVEPEKCCSAPPAKLGLGTRDEIGSAESAEPKKRSADAANLDNLLDTLIDEATQTKRVSAHFSSPAVIQDPGEESDEDEPELSVAAQHLDDAIAEAMAAAESKAQEELLKQLEDREKTRLKALSEQITSSLAGFVQLTPSGDIPVHPLPLPPAPPASPIQPSPPCLTPFPPPPPSPPFTRVNQPRQRPSSVKRLATSRPTADTAAAPARSKPLGLSVALDRRTRASGARNSGRRLNLPLPSAHTPVDDRIDETALAPSLLESIQVVTLERPRNTFPELAKDAIFSHPAGKMTAADIFKVVEKKYPYFVTAPESWKATMRNVLTSHSCFVKIPRPADAPGRGDWWSTVDLPLWKRRRTTAKAKQDEDFLGRHAREQMRKDKVNSRPSGNGSVVTGSSSAGSSGSGGDGGMRSVITPTVLSLPRPFDMGMT